MNLQETELPVQRSRRRRGGRRGYLEIPTGGLQEETRSLLLDAGHSHELPQRLLPVRHLAAVQRLNPAGARDSPAPPRPSVCAAKRYRLETPRSVPPRSALGTATPGGPAVRCAEHRVCSAEHRDAKRRDPGRAPPLPRH